MPVKLVPAKAGSGHPALFLESPLGEKDSRHFGHPAEWRRAKRSSKNNYLSLTSAPIVTPAEAGVQKALKSLDSGFRRNDISPHLAKGESAKLILRQFLRPRSQELAANALQVPFDMRIG
jgi:hypothetical protein